MLDAALTFIPNHRRAGNAYMAGDLYASQLAWNDKMVVSPRGGIPREKTQAAGKHLPADDKTWAYTWPIRLPRTQRIEALALTANAALYGGRTTDPRTGLASGFLWIVSLETGERTAEFLLESPPACDGLAVAGERIYLSLTSGQLLCFGK